MMEILTHNKLARRLTAQELTCKNSELTSTELLRSLDHSVPSTKKRLLLCTDNATPILTSSLMSRLKLLLSALSNLSISTSRDHSSGLLTTRLKRSGTTSRPGTTNGLTSQPTSQRLSPRDPRASMTRSTTSKKRSRRIWTWTTSHSSRPPTKDSLPDLVTTSPKLRIPSRIHSTSDIKY